MTSATLTFGSAPNYISQAAPGLAQYMGTTQSGSTGGGGGGQKGYDGTIQVFGGKIVNGHKTVFVPCGLNLQFDYVSIQGGTNPWDFGGGNNPGAPLWSLYQSYSFNCVRIQVNCQSWLGDTVYDLNSAGTAWGASRSADPGGNYRQTLIDAVASAQAYGMYPLIAAQSSAPDLTFGGVTHHLSSNATPAVADANVLRFWQSIAATFGTQATPPTSSVGLINNAGVWFDLFNEPHPSYNYGPYKSGAGGTGSTLTAAQVILNGGYGGIWPYSNLSKNGGASGTTSQWQPVVGYQAMVNAIEATGAQNVWVLEGDKYCRTLSTGLSYLPTSSFGQGIFSIHSYAPPGGNTYPETGSYVYVETDEGDGSSGTSTSLHYARALIDAGYPVISGEDGGYAGLGCQSGEPHLQWVTGQVTAGNLSGIIFFAANPLDMNTQGTNTGSKLQTFGNYPGTLISGTVLTFGQGNVAHNFAVTLL